MMRICCPVLGISPSSTLGGEIHDREVLKGLARLGVKIEVLLPKNRPFPRTKNLKVSFAPIKHMFPPYIFNFFALFYLFKTYKRKKFDLIRVHNPYFVGPAAFIFKLFHPEIPIVPFYHHFEKSRVRDILDNFFIKKWDLILTGSKASRKEIIRRFDVAPSKIRVVYHGVLRHFEPQKKDKKLITKYKLQDKIVLLFVGVLTKRKNVSFLLNLLAKMRNQNLVLIICGQGSQLKNLKKRTKVLELGEQVIFLGFQKDLVRLYNLADIFVLPTLKEGFGLVVAEAMLCEKPVLVSNNSSLPEIVDDGKNGFLVETNNLRTWERKLEILLDNKHLRKQFGRRGRKKILENFSWEKTCARTYKIYENLLKK